MLRKLGIQAQLILFLILALVLVTAGLEIVQIIQQRDSLVDAERKRSQTLIGSVNATIQTVSPEIATLEDITELNDRLSSLVEQNEDVDFIAVTWPDGQVIFHSEASHNGQQIAMLADLPGDRTVRRDTTEFDHVYITTARLDNPAANGPARFNIQVGVAAELIDSQLQKSILSSFAIALGAIGLVGILTAFLLHINVTHPLQTVRAGAKRFGLGHFDDPIKPQGSLELRELSGTLNTMARELKQAREELITLYHDMEMRVEDRTRDLQMTAEIGRVATSLRRTDRLLHETVEQIRQRFDVIYHAQIFLLDNVGNFAVLVESTGAVGQQLLKFGHKLPVGSNSVIGRVTARGQTVMASDTLAGDVPWQPNPLLPDTRAEMALPLRIEDRVIGALDVQSKQPDVFTDEMVRIFEVLADQLAIAIENARLLTESEQRVREIDALNRQLTRGSWQAFSNEWARPPVGYVYDQMQITPIRSDTDQQIARRIETAIQVHGETIGTLATTLPDNHELRQEDRLLVEAVAERVALAVENARLFQQTQHALAETERLYETARTVSSAPDLETIYQLVVEQLSTGGDVDSIEILLAGPDPMLAQYLENVYLWQRTNGDTDSASGEQIPLTPRLHGEESLLPVDAPATYADVARDLAFDHPLYEQLTRLSARSVLLAPLSAAGRWFGVLVCGSQTPGEFEAVYVTFASALADQLAIAIENRRLFEESQLEARRARALAEAGQLAGQIGGDYETGLQNLFQAVAGPGNYNRWWFGLLTDSQASLQQVTAREIPDAEIINVLDDQNTLAEAARSGEIVLVNDARDHPIASFQTPETVAQWGKHIAMPVKIGLSLVGVLLIGRGLDEHNLDERDIQLAATLASQIAVATQNQRLFAEAENQRKNLQSIVNTMPTGILVMNRAGEILLSNQELIDLLGPGMQPGTSEHPEPYPTVQAGTHNPYPRSNWPLNRVFETGSPATVDDMVILQPTGLEISVLAQAAPILNPDGSIQAVVGAFQDITELQALEHALQDSLRETTQLYETSRAISRVTDMDDLLRVTLTQIGTLQPDQVAIFFASHDSPGSASTLAASEPPDLADLYDVTPIMAMLKPDPAIVEKRNVTGPLVDYLEQTGLNTLGIFPLAVRSQVTGWIVLGFAASQSMTNEQRRFMTTLVDQAAVTIENQRLLLRTAAALEETAILYHASRSITDAQTPVEILQTIVHNATARTVHQAALYLLLSETQDSTFAAIEVAATAGSSPVDPIGTRYRTEQFPFKEAFATPEIFFYGDLSQARDDVTDLMRLACEQMRLQSLTLIPLWTGEHPLGLIMIGLQEPWPDADTELRVFEALADQAAVSLENSRLYRQAQRRARQLSTSAEISRAVTSILHLDDLLPQVVNLIRDSFEYDHAQIFLLSDDGSRANLVASTGEAGQQLLERRHSLPVGSRSVVGQVMATGEPQIALDTADARAIHYPNPLLPRTRSEMALPLIAKGQILGALDVQSNQSGAFTDADTRMLASLADMVATAIDNARLFELSEQRAEEMAFLFNVTTAAAASPDLEESLAQAVETLRATMNVTSASIYLTGDRGDTLVKGADVGTTSQETAPSTIAVDRGLVGWVARHDEAVVIGDISQDPRRLPSVETTRSAMALPLRSGGDVIGVLAVESDRLNAFDEEDLRLMQTLSSSLATIIHNSRLLSEVQAANEQLLEVDRLKTNFLAAMSHELRTPLNSIIGFSRVILKGIDGPLTEMQEQDIATIYDSGKHLLGLVNDILDQAKIEAGKMELAFAYFKLQDVISGVMSSAVGLTRDKPIRLHSEIADELPDAYGDEFRTRQVLLNLISNAAKFTDEGSVTVTAFPMEEYGSGFIQVSVTDTGIGIAEKDMPKLFEAFQQVDNSLTRRVGGTGMGLPLARSLTELQNGRMWVESQPGIGSTFSILVPTAPMADETGSHDETGMDGTPGDGATSSENAIEAPAPLKTVLVIENTVEAINLYRRYLARAGYEVIGTTHSEEITNMLMLHRPALIVLDVNVQDEAGWGVLEQLKSADTFSTIPVVICSLNPDSQRGLEMGAVAYLQKPFTEDQLLDAMRYIKAETERQRILLVDDKPETIRSFREALEETQYVVLEATTGRQALSLIDEIDYIDLVILDLRMPEVDGFEVLQYLRGSERTAAIPVLVLTAEDVNAEERSSLETIDIFRKDLLDEQSLLSRIQSQLGHPQEKR